MSEIVAYCKVCNAPIYGPRIIGRDYGFTAAVYSCQCLELLRAKVAAETNLLHAQAERIRSEIQAPLDWKKAL